MLFGGDGSWYKQFGNYMAFPLTTKNSSKDVAHWQSTCLAYVMAWVCYLAFVFFFKKALKIVLSHDPTIPLLGIYSKDLE